MKTNALHTVRHLLTACFILLLMLLVMLMVRPSLAAELQPDSLGRAGILLEEGKADSAAVILFDIMETLGQDQREQRAEALYYLAMSMKALGRLGEEINCLISARETGIDVPFADNIRLSYAQILLDTGNFDGCIGILEEFRESFSSSPLMPDILYTAGNAHLARKDYLRASNIYNEILNNYPEASTAGEALMKSAVCLYHLDLVNGAIQQLERYLSQNPGGANIRDALYTLGHAYMQRDNTIGAANTFKRLTLRFPDHPELIDLNYLMGKLFFESGEFVESENAFENFVFNSNPDDDRHDEALYYLERIKFRTGRYAHEYDIAENFIAKYPDSPRAPSLLFDLAHYYQARKMMDSAIEHYQVLLNNPLYSAYADSAALLIADTYYQNNMTEKARLFLASTAESSSDTTRIQLMHCKLGEISELEERYDEAIAFYDLVLEKDAGSDLALRSLRGIARTFRAMQRWLEAAKTNERIINEFPVRGATVDTYIELSEIFFLQGNTLKSANTALKAASIADSSRKYELTLNAAELFENIDEDQAFDIYEELYNNSETPPQFRTTALMHYGDLASRSGLREIALSAFDRVVADAADSIAVIEARRKIGDIQGSVADSTGVIRNQ